MTGTQKALRGRRLVLWGLALSLALNGFLIGLIATGQLSEERRRGLLHIETRSVSANLPDEHREALREALRERLPELREDWRRLRQIRREVNALAAVSEPDRPAIDARLAEIRDITSAMQAEVQRLVFDQVLSLPPETRAAMAAEEQD